MKTGLAVGQVCAIFCLPEEFGSFPDPLAYIEWFTAFQLPVPDLEMYQISRSTRQYRRHASIIPVPQAQFSRPARLSRVVYCLPVASPRSRDVPNLTIDMSIPQARVDHSGALCPFICSEMWKHQESAKP